MTRILAAACAGFVLLLILVAGSAAGVIAALPGGGGGTAGCLTASPGSVPSLSVADPTGCDPIGQTVLARAAGWLTAWHGGPVPYRSSGDPTTWFGGYRRDCSGYASMALGLPGPGLTTTQLATRSTPIPKTSLTAGDLLINPAPDLRGHVVIFDHWADATMSAYIGYEQSGDGGTHHRVIPYPYFGAYPMSPYRYDSPR